MTAPKDRLEERARDVCSCISGAFHESFDPACDDCDLIRAALETVVRECASKVGGVVPDTSGCDCDDAILRHWGLEEKP